MTTMVKIIEERYCYTDMYKDPGGSGGSRECYQGIWWGPERIWVDDLVRLNATRKDLLKDSRNEFLRDPTADAVGRATLAHISEFAYDTKMKQICFSARLYEVTDDSVGPDPFGLDINLRQPGCFYCSRRITKDNVEIYLPIQFIAGWYDPAPINSEAHRRLLQRVLNPPLLENLVESQNPQPEAEANLLRILIISGLYTAQEKNRIIASE
ncbi:hypothetical protein FRB97_004148 [Tulasnella sp. 331]|nr:hypothetical protein FRB97_004148 [Tulasnella sp. 331]